MADSTSGSRRGTALVTGASSGIGARLARRFAGAGFDLVLVARREEALKTLAGELARAHGIEARTIRADLTDPESPRSILAHLQEGGVTIDALVNNAGFAVHGPFAETPERSELDLVQVNIAALVHLTKLFLPGMIARRRGWVLNLASVAGFLPGPLMAAYYASKAFVLSFSEALAAEVAGSGVNVTALCPGPTRTGFADVAGVQDTRLFRDGTLDADEVARAGFEGLMAGRRVVIPGFKYRLFVFGRRLVPSRLMGEIARQLNGPAH